MDLLVIKMDNDIECKEICFLEKLDNDKDFKKEINKLKKENDCQC